jgi:hypothetical protein
MNLYYKHQISHPELECYFISLKIKNLYLISIDFIRITILIFNYSKLSCLIILMKVEMHQISKLVMDLINQLNCWTNIFILRLPIVFGARIKNYLNLNFGLHNCFIRF